MAALTHAGGVVFRITPEGPQVLVLTARHRLDHWVLPKGHIEAGENPGDAAVREVGEEAGVAAQVLEVLEDVRIRVGEDDQVIRYFLMRAEGNAEPHEGRRSLWLAPREAESLLSFEEARGTLRRASRALSQRGVV